MNCTRSRVIVSALFSTDKLISLLQVLSKLPKPSVQIGLCEAYLCPKFEAKRCVLDYIMNCFGINVPKPPCAAPQCCGFSMGNLWYLLEYCLVSPNDYLYQWRVLICILKMSYCLGVAERSNIGSFASPWDIHSALGPEPDW